MRLCLKLQKSSALDLSSSQAFAQSAAANEIVQEFEF
jgi:hypothetical protein